MMSNSDGNMPVNQVFVGEKSAKKLLAEKVFAQN
jgi:hypothetical protein